MRSVQLGKWLLIFGVATTVVGVGLCFYVDSETLCVWLVGAALPALYCGALIWAIRADPLKCLLAALCIVGICSAVFRRINVHGATAIFLPMVLMGGVITLLLLSTALVRYFTPRLGRYAYLLGAIPCVVVGVALFYEYEVGKPNQGQPAIVTATKFSKLIKSLPQSAHFSISGLSFFAGKLYVGTNVGMVEVVNAKVARLFQFQRLYSVVSGPWLDRAGHLLWAKDDHTGELLRFDGQNWTRMRVPDPGKGYSHAGIALEGLRPIGNREGFWLASGGMAWKWDSNSADWRASTLPHPLDYHDPSVVIGVLPIGHDVVLIVRHELEPMLARENSEFSSDEAIASADPTAPPLQREGDPFLADTWAVSEQAGYVCTKNHTLMAVTKERVAPLEAPGECEAVATDDTWNLLVSIRSKGVFRYADEQWTLIAESPYPSGAGDYWTYLSTSSGELAIAIDGQPVIDRQTSTDKDMRFTRNASTNLWVLKERKFVPVDF